VTAALGAYPHTEGLLSGERAPTRFRFAWTSFPVISRAFAPMAREQRFDLSEMAIATFLQAKAYGKPLVLLPIVLAARFQEQALLCRADADLRSPADLAGRRVGVRAYSQTTGLWLRGELAESYGVQPEQIAWVTFEDAHVAEYVDPPFATRAPAGKDLLTMLRAGELDAAIVGNDVPEDPQLRCVFANAQSAGEAFYARHRLVPINHMLVATEALVARSPEIVDEIVGLFGTSGSPLSFGRPAVDAAVALALRYATEQGLLPRPLTLDDVWAGSPARTAAKFGGGSRESWSLSPG
ncbi:MAG: ABC transporter substrate-binding protein, partial [Acidisphaera sp.]|nr:ABC transporter substrate-binding protein [Acidisphaera sp.]